MNVIRECLFYTKTNGILAHCGHGRRKTRYKIWKSRSVEKTDKGDKDKIKTAWSNIILRGKEKNWNKAKETDATGTK